MKKIKLYPLQKPVEKTIEIPGSLSYTIRALMIAAMTEGSVTIQNALKSDDTYAMYTILKTLGIKLEEGENYFIVHGNIKDVEDKEYILDVNISGRTARSALALLTIIPGIKTLTCKEGFKKRPVGDLVDGLRQLGAKIEYIENEGFLPLKIVSSKLSSGTAKMAGKLSSQYFSAIMMIAPLIGEIVIEVIGEQSSKPFIDVTINTMKEFGVEVINENYQKYHIKENQHYKNPEEYLVEADAIAASYFWGIAAITKSKIRVLHLSPTSAQGDVAFADILEKMGCLVSKNLEENWIEVEGTERLSGITVDMNATPDSSVTLCAVAAFANGVTRIKGLEHIKIKETDRIQAPKNELQKMGIAVEADTDSITIQGGKPTGATIDTYGDHRIAMAFAVIGSKINEVIINNPDVVNKSFTNFWDKLKELGIGVEEI
jgi:3-phosphoshikimate 1-carboxyvinyltransferase